MKAKMPGFYPALVVLWIQVRNQCLSAEAAFKIHTIIMFLKTFIDFKVKHNCDS